MEIEKGEIITLEDGKEYICFGRAVADNQKKYLYLMTIAEPIEVRFAEETTDAEGVRVRILGSSSEKQLALEAFKQSIK